jgi:hypothetical protein
VSTSRAARGLKPNPCRQCSTGLRAGAEKTFDPRCPGCLEKLAKGLRTGLEPMPSMGRKRLSPAAFGRYMDRVKLGRKKLLLSAGESA